MDSSIVNKLDVLFHEFEEALRTKDGYASLMHVAQKAYNLIIENPGEDYSRWMFARAWDLSRGSYSISVFRDLCVEAVQDRQVAEWCDTSRPLPSGSRVPSRTRAVPPAGWLYLQAKHHLDRDGRLSAKQRKALLAMAESDTVHATDICTMYKSRTGARDRALPVIVEDLDLDRDLDLDLNLDLDLGKYVYQERNASD